MNVLFLTLLDFSSIEEKNIYTDLMRVFVKNEHNVYIISPVERSKKINTHLIEEKNCKILKLKIGNTQKTNVIEKGISTLLIESQFKSAINKFFSDVKFDLVLYSTPPITFAKTILYVKKRDNAVSYLMLKDIFPQNAVDLRMFSEKSVLYKFFRNKEKKLYEVSDYIGCMSQANVDYIIRNNDEINPARVEICPNSAEVDYPDTPKDKLIEIRKKYSIPEDKIVFIYGGNLGKPQGIPFLIKCLETQKHNDEVFFVIVGGGTEYPRIKNYIDKNSPHNVLLIEQMAKQDYELINQACDIGMIFLDNCFTIPNFPSRILSYLQFGKPVFAATDNVTDIRNLIEDNDIGVWMRSDDEKQFEENVRKICKKDYVNMSENSRKCFERNFDVNISYQAIMAHFTEIK